jgi:hypothetical protein
MYIGLLHRGNKFNLVFKIRANMATASMVTASMVIILHMLSQAIITDILDIMDIMANMAGTHPTTLTGYNPGSIPTILGCIINRGTIPIITIRCPAIMRPMDTHSRVNNRSSQTTASLMRCRCLMRFIPCDLSIYSGFGGFFVHILGLDQLDVPFWDSLLMRFIPCDLSIF